LEEYDLNIQELIFLGPGYCNSAFSNVPVLKARVLSVWDRERALMPDRSSKAPKGIFLT
jgi:hypothetical protein